MSSETTGQSRKLGPSRKSRRCGSRVRYHLGVSAAKFGLVGGEDGQHLDKIKEQSGAKVRLDEVSRLAGGIRILVVTGTWTQIKEAVRLIVEKAGVEEVFRKEALEFWRQWIAHAYPELLSKAYFLPPIFMNRVPMTREKLVSGHELNVLRPSNTFAVGGGQLSVSPRLKDIADRETPGALAKDTDDKDTANSDAAGVLPQPTKVQGSDIVKDAALERVILCLQKMADAHKEIFMAISQLPFGNYLRDPAHLPASVLLPIIARLPAQQRQGSFDLLLMTLLYGFVVCEVKATESSASLQDIGMKMRKAAAQLDKAQGVLTFLVSDVAPGIRVTKVIVLPNLSSSEVQRTLEPDRDLTQFLCQCLGAADIDDVVARCICSDQLPSSQESREINEAVVKLSKWWQLHVIYQGHDPLMTQKAYENIVARFCGPATTVTVPSVSSPRLTLRTMGQAVSETGECYAQIALFPEQVGLICSAPCRVFLAGPPGTGKTVALQLMALEWLRCGHDVHVVGSSEHSRIVCCMMRHLLQQSLNGNSAPVRTQERVHLVQYNLRDASDVLRATEELTEAARKGELYVIVDEVGPDEVGPVQDYPHLSKQRFKKFCADLSARVPHLHLWAASCKHGVAPDGWQVEAFTRPLRCPPSVVREVERAQEIGRMVECYSSRGVPDHTQGPPVEFIEHEGAGHSGLDPLDCKQCGNAVGVFLKSLGVGGQEKWVEATRGDITSVTAADADSPPGLCFKDVLVLCIGQVADSCGVVEGLKDAGIAVRVMTASEDDIEDVATARSDVVWVSNGNVVRGIERKVVVCVRNEYPDTDAYNRLYPLSRCTSQLVLVLPARPPSVNLERASPPHK